MINVIVGFVVGFLFAVLLRLFAIDRREKKGLHEARYKKLNLTSKMKNTVRQIIFKFSIQKFNRDFLLNLKLNGRVIIQLMHRSHFPELIKNLSDAKFGLAIYIPIKPLTKSQQQVLIGLLNEESEQINIAEYPIEYLVIDAGSRARYSGYLIARIITEVFETADVDLELYDEGVLPYHYQLDIPTKGKLNEN